MKKVIVIFGIFAVICSLALFINYIKLALFINYIKKPKVVVIEKSIIPNEYLGEFDCTHYTHTGNKTSTGVYPKAGRTVAVDPKKIPYGTCIYVEGYGVLIAEDCGGDIKGSRLDVFVDTHQEAVQLGRKKVKVWLLTK